MPIISNENNFFCENHFVFLENEILVKSSALTNNTGTPLNQNDLPDDKTLHKILEAQFASDWFCEPEKNYCAFMLEKDSPLPAGYSTIPLRSFFWKTKSPYEQENALPCPLGNLASRAHGFLRLRETYIYCPKCGKKLEVSETLTAKVCPSCGREDFPRIEPAVIVLVSRNTPGGKEVLLVKSKTSVNKYFSCIAGFIEHGETAEETVKREVLEETGITVKNIRYVGSQAWPFPDQLMLAFRAALAGGEIKIQEEEIADAAWFKRDSLPETPPPGSVAYNLIFGKF